MKKFILNIIRFFLSFFILTYSFALFIKYTNVYQQFENRKEDYHSFNKSKQKRQANKLLIGDSVGYQVFPSFIYNDSVNSIASNQAIGIIGQFLLLNNYLNAGNKVDTVFLMYTPTSFKNNLDQIYTFHYFLKPFYTKEYKFLFSEQVLAQIRKIPFYRFCQLPYILTSNWAPDFISKDNTNYTFLSPISVEYLKKIKDLSKKYNFKFIIISPPVSESKRDVLAGINKNEITETDLEKEFKSYFSSIVFLNDSNFVEDGIHLKSPGKFSDYYYKKYMK